MRRFFRTKKSFSVNRHLEQQEHFCWFQQDGATAHMVREMIAFLREFFGDRLISHPNWPPRSLDLTPPDFFLWRYVKDKIFHNPPSTMDELKLCITETINAIELQALRKVVRNMQESVTVFAGTRRPFWAYDLILYCISNLQLFPYVNEFFD